MRRPIVLATVLVLVLGACGGGDSSDAVADATTVPTTSVVRTTTTTPTTTSAAATTTTTTEAPPVAGGLNEEFLADLVAMLPIPEGKGAALAVVINAEGDVAFAATGSDHDGHPPTPDDGFRIGSISKLLAAVVTLQLVEEGVVDLEAPAGRYVTRVVVPDGVRVQDLLQHTSGLHDYVNALAYQGLPDDPERVWSPEAAYEIVEDRRPLFAPGERYSYSNSNYLILGLLIEEVTGNSYVEELRSRVIEPLGMDDTYLAGFEDGPPPFDAYYWSELRGPVLPVDFDYTGTATLAWAGGAVVSTAADLHTLLSAVAGEEVVGATSLEVMTGMDEAGPSVFLPPSNQGVYWHAGHIIGYVCFAAHVPDTGTTAFLAVTTDRYYRTVENVVERFRQELQVHATA